MNRDSSGLPLRFVVMDAPPPDRPTWSDPRRVNCGFAFRGVEAPRCVTFVTQVHGNATSRVEWGPGKAWPAAPSEGDALWTTSTGLPVAVRVADCVPILLWTPGAVAAVHAGWRGTAANIVGATLAWAAEELAVDPRAVFAAIGPCISRDRFEVGPEVVEGLLSVGLQEADLDVITGPRGRPHVDLRRANRALLTRAGVPDEQIEDVGGCSWSEPRYESYRRDGAASGRMLGFIARVGGP